MSSFGSLCILLTVLLLQTGCQGYESFFSIFWHNYYDEPLYFKCPSDSYAVTRIQSSNNSRHQDRKFKMSCSQVNFSSLRKSCYWTDYVNSFDELVHFTCKSNHFINGMNSYHVNYNEDRRWKFHCCAIADLPLHDCELSGWTNSYNGRQDYMVPTGHVIKGVISVHRNKYEDRLYEYLVCKLEDEPQEEALEGSGDGESMETDTGFYTTTTPY